MPDKAVPNISLCLMWIRRDELWILCQYNAAQACKLNPNSSIIMCAFMAIGGPSPTSSQHPVILKM